CTLWQGRRRPRSRLRPSRALDGLVAIVHRLLDERCDAARIFLLRNVAAGERTNRPAARFGALPALVHLRALFGRLAFGDERDVGDWEFQRRGILIGNRLIEAL